MFAARDAAHIGSALSLATSLTAQQPQQGDEDQPSPEGGDGGGGHGVCPEGACACAREEREGAPSGPGRKCEEGGDFSFLLYTPVSMGGGTACIESGIFHEPSTGNRSSMHEE